MAMASFHASVNEANLTRSSSFKEATVPKSTLQFDTTASVFFGYTNDIAGDSRIFLEHTVFVFFSSPEPKAHR